MNMQCFRVIFDLVVVIDLLRDRNPLVLKE